MKVKDFAQVGFSTILFDTLFGLVIFFGLDAFLEIKAPHHFAFYACATIIVVHWWLLFKAADDAFGDEVADSATDIIFGILYIILIDYIILLAKGFSYGLATKFLIGLLFVDLAWSLAWRYIGAWHTKDRQAIRAMEHELERSMIIDTAAIVLFFALLSSVDRLSAPVYVCLFVGGYAAYIIASFWEKVIDLRKF